MSADFEKVLIKDPRLDVSDSIKYGVIKGGQNVTASPFNAISASNSQLVFNIQVPSEQTIIDRRVLLQTELNLELTFIDPQGWYSWFPTQTNTGSPTFTIAEYPSGTINPQYATGSCYGSLSALASFPLHQLMTVMNATINNNTVSLNIRDVLPAMIRMLDLDDLVGWNNSSPTFPDTLASYTSNYGTLNSPHSAYWGVNDPRMVHRGCFVPTKFATRAVGAPGNVPASPAYPAFPTVITERWAWLLTEPLLLSPFIFANLKCNGQGFYGIQNLNFVFNIGDTSRVYRGFNGQSGDIDLTDHLIVPSYEINSPAPYYAASANWTYSGALPYLSVASTGNNVVTSNSDVPVVTTVQNGVIPGWSDGATNLFTLGKTRLLFNFLTPHPSDLMPARNIVPFYELPRYISAGGAVSAAVTNNDSVGNGFATTAYSVLTPGTGLLQTNSLQLNQIPDKLIIFVRKLAGNQNFGDPDVALPITRVSINFNNMSGILASANAVQLWQMSRENGLNSSWIEFSGSTITTRIGNVARSGSTVPPPTNATNATYIAANPNYSDGTNPSNPSFIASVSPYSTQVVSTVGSYLCLEFGKDIQLTEDFYAAGSLGNFNLQVQVDVANYNLYAYNSTNPCEIVLVTMNSGVFVCERGTSSTYTGILTKQDVLEASQQDHYTHDDVKRMVGGGIFRNFLSSAASAAKNLGSQALQKGKEMALEHGKKFVSDQVAQRAPAMSGMVNQAMGGPAASSSRRAPSRRAPPRRRGRGLEEHY